MRRAGHAPPLGDEVMVTRAARQVGVRAAGIVALAMLALVVLVAVLVVRGQDSAADHLLRTAAATADDVGDPPPGSWLVLAAGGRVTVSPGLPAELGPELARLRRFPRRTVVLSDLRTDDSDSFRIATRARREGTVQVVLDLTSQRAQRSRLLTAMGAAGAVALLFAAALGVVLGRRAVRPLADALALQRTFVADASHELRTPLTLLSTRAQLLDRALQREAAGPAGEQLLQDCAGVVRDVQRLGEVLEDLLLAADPRSQAPVGPLDVDEVVAAAVDSARATAGSAGVLLHGRAASAGSGACRVQGAGPALRRAVLALVDNAIDHTPPGGTVTVMTRRERRQVVVSVSDTGPGIASGAGPEILRRFSSGGGRAGRAHYGLGLALTHDVANRHGGQLRVVEGRAPGTGAVLELVLPALE